MLKGCNTSSTNKNFARGLVFKGTRWSAAHFCAKPGEDGGALAVMVRCVAGGQVRCTEVDIVLALTP